MSVDLSELFKEISPIAEKVFSSYANKGTVDNGTWLTGFLAANETTAKDAPGLSRTIQAAVGRFSENMKDLDASCAARRTKERWLKDFIKSNADLNQEQQQQYLAQVDAALRRGNEVMVNFIIAPAPVDVTQENLPPVEQDAHWDGTIINDIAQQSVLMGYNGVQILINQNALQGEEILQEDITAGELNPKIDEGLKMAMAAALKIGHASEKIPCLPKGTPLSALVDVACVGIEIAKNIGRAALGKIKVSKAMENVGRASIIFVADICATGMPAMAFEEIPIVGSVLSTMCAGLLVSRSSKKIQQDIYAGIKEIKSAANKIAGLAVNAVGTVKNTIRNAVNTVVHSH